jgi:raffinose/stachyose/melibiose transport system permease protein
MSKKNNFVPILVVVPFMILFFIFFYAPALLGISYSLTDWNGVDRVYNFVGIKNYITAFRSASLLNTLSFTLRYSILVLVFSNVIGLIIALALNREMKYRTIFRSIFFFPAVLCMLTISYIFGKIDYFLVPEIKGFLNTIFHLGLSHTSFLGNQKLAIYAVAFVHVWQAVSITTVIYLAGLQSIPESIIESSRLDGVSGVKKLIKITIPLIVPSIMINFITNLKNALNAFDYIVATTGGGPGHATQSLTLYIYNQYVNFKFAYSTAVSIILFVIFAFFSVIQIKVLRKREVEY